MSSDDRSAIEEPQQRIGSDGTQNAPPALQDETAAPIRTRRGEKRVENRRRQVARVPEDRPRELEVPRVRARSIEPESQVLDFEVASLPRREERKRGFNWLSFFLVVVVPTLLGCIYFLGVASDQYVAEFKFAVSDSSPASMGPSMASSVASMMSGGSAATASSTPNYMVADYVTSSNSVDELQKRIGLRELFSKPFIDWWVALQRRRLAGAVA